MKQAAITATHQLLAQQPDQQQLGLLQLQGGPRVYATGPTQQTATNIAGQAAGVVGSAADATQQVTFNHTRTRHIQSKILPDAP